MKSNKIYLGAIGLAERFVRKGVEYRTITQPPSKVNHSYGHRWVLNLKTLKAVWFYCREKVAPCET